MAHRHKVHAKHKNVGGGTVTYAGGDSNVAKEAKHKLHKHGGKVHGSGGHHRVDKRARGGGVGADTHPFSSAHMGK